LRVRDGKVAKTVPVGKRCSAALDVSRSGQLIGIEMFEPGQLTVKQFRRISRDYNVKGLETVNISRLQEAFA